LLLVVEVVSFKEPFLLFAHHNDWITLNVELQALIFLSIGGLASSRRAASYGAKVGLAENWNIGGTCVNVGCVPKKVMWNTANLAELLHDAKDYG
jgi:hypothetical protein